MTTERKKWWRKVALASVGGTVVVGGLFGIVRATSPEKKPEPSAPMVEDAAWTRAPAAAPARPAVSEVERAPVVSDAVVPASATLPVPLPALPTAPVPAVGVPAPPVPVPVTPAIEPVGSGPRAPDAGLLNADKVPLPPIPSLDLPKVPAAPKIPDAKPTAPVIPVPPAELPGLPSLPSSSAELPKAPSTPPLVPPPTSVPQEPGFAPVPAPIKPTETAPPVLPMKPDSGLNPAIPQNTLNPSSPVAPTPAGFPPVAPGGRETPGTTVDRPKPVEPSFGTTDKFVFPVPVVPDPLASTPRDSTMLNLKHAAAAAILGGAILGAEQARSAPVVPLPVKPVLPTATGAADDKEVEQLKKDLKAANEKIEKLEKKIDTLTNLLLGKKDELGYPIPSDPGAVAEIKSLKDQLSALKTQTALKPAVTTPEVKPKGIVRVVNEYPVEISMVINDKSHRIAPSAKLDVEVPAGDFSYQLLQSGAPATRSIIKDKETVTLRIK